MRRHAWTLALLWAVSGSAWAAPSSASVTTNKSEYSLMDETDLVLVTLKNTGSTSLTMSNQHVQIWRDALLVFNYKAVFIMAEEVLPGKTVTYTWNKKDSNGKLVAAGSYRAKWILSSGEYLSPDFALATAGTETKLALTTDRPVYATGGTDPVTISVNNYTTQSFTMPSQLFTIWKENVLVFEEGWATIATPSVGAGGSKSWVWAKKDYTGKPVGSGTYTIKVGPIQLGNTPVSLSIRIALTPTGKIAGSSRFPLATGNEWVYSVEQYLLTSPPPATTESMKILQAWSAYNLAYVKNFVGADRWVWMTGQSRPVLQVWAAPSGQMEALFRFNRSVGYTYAAPSLFPTGTKMRVGWTNDTVTTPAGTFKGCYRLDTVNPATAPSGAAYHSYWFAPGIGLVQSLSGSYLKNTYRRLLRATLKGSDGMTYFIGQ